MRALAGQAALHAGRVLHRVLQIALAGVILALLVVAILAWRLSEGPLELPFVARRIEAAAAARGQPLHIAQVSLRWGGFSRGGEPPLLVHLSGMRADDGSAGGAQLADLDLSFSVPALLRGELVPRTIVASGARLRLARDPAGNVAVAGLSPSVPPVPTDPPAAGPPAASGPAASDDVAADPAQTATSPAELLQAITHPEHGALAQLRHVHIHGAQIALDDRQSGLQAHLGPIDIDLDRAGSGGISGHASVTIAAGAQHATLTLDASVAADGGASELRAALTPLDPAALAPLLPALAPAAALQAPITVSANATLGADLGLRRLHVDLGIGAGIVHAAEGTAPILAAALTVDGTLDRLDLVLTRLEMSPGPDRPHTAFTGHAAVARAAAGGGYTADAVMDVDHVTFADLPALWPKGTGGPGTRPWMTKNIPAGLLRDGHLTLSLTAPADLSDVALTAIDGHLYGDDLTVSWLRPVPPIEHVNGHLTITDPDVIEIAVDGGTQSGGAQGGIRLGRGHIRLTGIAGKDQFADIETDLGGPVADLVRTLNHPRLKLLSKQSTPLRDPAGRLVGGHLSVGHLALKDSVSMDDIAIRATGHLAGIHLTGLAAGRDLDRGQLDMVATNDGLTIGGAADLAHIPAKLQVAMDFRAGPPSQVTQQVHVVATVTDRQLADLGLPPAGFFTGSGDLDAHVAAHRSGRTDIAVDADLTAAALAVTQAGYAKPAGSPASAAVRVTLEHDRLATIPLVRVSGRGVDVRGSADIAHGRPEVLRLDRLVLGEGTDAHGVVALPVRPGDAYRVALAGRSLDLSGVLATRAKSPPPSPSPSPSPPAQPTAAAPPGPPWTADVQLDRLILGQDRLATRVRARVEHDATGIRRASVTATLGATPASLSVTPVPGGRAVAAQTADLGAVLQAAGVTADVHGGRLSLTGVYDDARPDHPLTGTLDLREFRILNAPVIGRILKAATLYGVIDLLRGPGLGFTRATTDFVLTHESVLDLRDARAYSPSLGATAQGRVDIDAGALDLRGTVVPAYFFNALPGRIPVVGRLFSAERGGGVIAAMITLRGPFADLHVGVNPLSVLTPGLLRRVFDLFGPTSPTL